MVYMVGVLGNVCEFSRESLNSLYYIHDIGLHAYHALPSGSSSYIAVVARGSHSSA